MICQKQLVLFNGSFPELCALGLGLWLPKLGCRALGFGFCLEFRDLGFRFMVWASDLWDFGPGQGLRMMVLRLLPCGLTGPEVVP